MFIPFLAGTAHSSCNYLYSKFGTAFRVGGQAFFLFFAAGGYFSHSNVTCGTNVLYQLTQTLGYNFL